ncbi:FKBP-type peptidyl-prolyl cis-trans isomerase [Kineosporia sp. R_H_3]|uniref:FKBP-type peptidyl-prolyl cis-trans isomerase n=1 Tax=Kineosporia sp. R_H_3 TaxID=1961848 RepID=UPI001304134F|nr:FKBP-type peptidyl-prolyl cis-trans isomerase [Kineosporia sp. R_H_3]
MSSARPARLLRSTGVVALVAGLTLLLGGCKVPTGEVSAAAQATTNHDLSAVTVTAEEGSDPSLEVPSPFAVDKTETRVVEEGDGDTVGLGQQVTIRYTAVNGTDGQPLLDKTWASDPTTFVVGTQSTLPGFDDGLRGLRVGAKALIAIPPDAGYGVQGNTSLGVGPTDTIVCLVEVLDTQTLLTKAEGKSVAAKKGLPTVKRDAKGVPTVTLPKGKVPTSLVVQTLIAGDGAKVAKGDDVTVQYVGVIWPGGRVFDSSWRKPAPARFQIGNAKTITGWDGIIGQKVGSQVLLVVPPDKAYGAEGRDQFGIKGTDTLVFVVDILGAQKTAAA